MTVSQAPVSFGPRAVSWDGEGRLAGGPDHRTRTVGPLGRGSGVDADGV